MNATKLPLAKFGGAENRTIIEQIGAEKVISTSQDVCNLLVIRNLTTRQMELILDVSKEMAKDYPLALPSMPNQ